MYAVCFNTTGVSNNIKFVFRERDTMVLMFCIQTLDREAMLQKNFLNLSKKGIKYDLSFY